MAITIKFKVSVSEVSLIVIELIGGVCIFLSFLQYQEAGESCIMDEELYHGFAFLAG
jgi:hypothetical protein